MDQSDSRSVKRVRGAFVRISALIVQMQPIEFIASGQIRNPVLYPIELRAPLAKFITRFG